MKFDKSRQIEELGERLMQAIATREWRDIPIVLDEHRHFAEENLTNLDTQSRESLQLQIEQALLLMRACRSHIQDDLKYLTTSLSILNAYQQHGHQTTFESVG